MTIAVEMFKYQAAMTAIRQQIADGLPRGARLPTERELVEQLGVSRLTIRKALDALAAAGEIKRVQGSGTFVDGPTFDRGPYIRSFTQEMLARGRRPGASHVVVTRLEATAEIGWDLHLSPGTPIVEISRLRTADDIPMCIETMTFAASLVPGIETADLTGSMYALLRDRYGLQLAHVSQDLHATALNSEQAHLLSVAPHSPALEMKHVSYDSEGNPIETSTGVYRGDRYSIHLDLYPPNGDQ